MSNRPAHRADPGLCVYRDGPATQTDVPGRWDNGEKWDAPAVCDSHARYMAKTGNTFTVYYRDDRPARDVDFKPRHMAEPDRIGSAPTDMLGCAVSAIVHWDDIEGVPA